MKEIFNNFLNQYRKAIEKDIDIECLAKASDLISKTVSKQGKLIFVGNGGSAAMSSHVAVDFTKNAGIKAINFNEADLITCFANDYGYENWVTKSLEFYADSDDLVFLTSSSGNSKNIVNAAQYCSDNSIDLITLSGFDISNDLRSFGNVNFWVDSSEYNIVEMTHHIILLLLVDGFINTDN
ncbi:SIS domain-containing protein [Candidatus Marinimicrobia bacterium]|nr:SIS domain-containing protein [Candidatus Neomarinimicrobiota bacterium]